MKPPKAHFDSLPSTASSFRIYLQTELARRCSTNRQYSLRSFALQLDVDHSTLSQVLRGKRRLTPQMVAKFGRMLNLPVEDIKAFVDHEEMVKSGGTVAAVMVQQLTIDAVRLLSETHHQSILELLQLESFRPDVRWIARVLNSEPDEVNIALSRLLRLGLLEMSTPERWIDKSEGLVKDRNDFAAQVIRKLSERVRKISAAADDSGVDERPRPIRVRMNKSQLDSVLGFIEKMRGYAGDDTSDGGDERPFELTINHLAVSRAGKR
jgi:uncharacterized protein (TIGR02147 family)